MNPSTAWAGLRRHGWWWGVPIAAVVVTCLAAVAGTTWNLTGDFAHTEFFVRAVPGHLPLVGVAARVAGNGSTPGPSMAYLLAPGYRLFGSSAWALAVSLCVLHLVAVALGLAVARRYGSTLLAACVAGTWLVMTVSLAPRFFLEPWNVWVPVYAFGLFLLLVWAVALDHLAWLPLAVVVASHCVQTHISYTLLCAGLLGLLTVWIAWRWWRTDALAGRHPLRWLVIAAACGVVMWVPPLIEQFRPGTGNLTKIYDQFTDPGEPYVGIGAAAKALVGRLNLLGPWLHDPAASPRATPDVVGFVLFVALVGAGGWCAWQRRRRPELTMYAVLAASTVLGLASTARIFGTFYEYVVRWMLPLAAAWVATAAWSVIQTVLARHPAPANRRRLVGAGVLAMLAWTAVGVAHAATAQIPYPKDSALTTSLAGQLAARLDRSQTYQFDEDDPMSLGALGYGLPLALEKAGFRVGVGPWGTAGAMAYRVVTDEHADHALWYVSTQPLIDAFAAAPGAQVLATADVRTAGERQRSDTALAEVLRILCSTGHAADVPTLYHRWGVTVLAFQQGMPAALAAPLSTYTDLRQPAAVVELPAGTDTGTIRATPPVCP